MPLTTKHIPDEGVMLCEGCGYILEGLAPDGRCPECGKPVSESIDPNLRTLPSWERNLSPIAFITTSLRILFRPSDFFSHSIAHSDMRRTWFFALVWIAVSSVLLTLAVWMHSDRFMVTGTYSMANWRYLPPVYMYLFASAPVIILCSFLILTEIAARLTAWEAAYRGLRLPLKSVRRAMKYHSVHYVPVCLVALLTVWGYDQLRPRLTASADMAYLYTLCGEVIVFAAYLFFTYWAAMRSILFANK